MIGYARATVRLSALATLTLALLALYAASFWRSDLARRNIVRMWHRAAARIVGIQIRAHGPVAPAGTLIAANHISYIDILALGALTGATFVAKSSVARWPVIGFLSRLINTVFVDRAGTQSLGQVNAIARMLDRGHAVVMFPEGTSTAGRTVLPFKSTLFEAARRTHAKTPVQPVTVAYAKGRDGADLPIDERRVHPWIGDDELVPHLWALLQHPGVVADVLFHEPVRADAFASRKDLAEHCQAATAHGLVVARRRTALPAVAADAEDWFKAPLFGLLG